MVKAGLYIHIPFCSQKCPYCDFASFEGDLTTQKAYVVSMLKEIELLSRCSHLQGYVFDTVFVGGGTPSLLFRGGLSRIFDCLSKHFRLELDEFTIEANPESALREFFSECAALGANRVSFGLQSTSNRVLAYSRRHTYEDFLAAHKRCLKAGIFNINADLMLGLPHQTALDAEDSIKKLIDLGLSHVSVYGLSLEEGTPLQVSGYSLNEDEIAKFYDISADLLTKNGYFRYEVSNFSLAKKECKHNLKYWSLEPYVGIGLNASSYFHTQIRTTNTASLNDYLSGKYLLSKENVSDLHDYEYTMLSLRTSKGLELNRLKNPSAFLGNPKVKYFLDRKILRLRNNRVTLNETFYYLMNSVLKQIL